MPIYEFICPKCNKLEEHYLNQKDLDNTHLICNKCEIPLEIKISVSHINSSKRKQEPIIPINLVDINKDGSFKITSTSRDPIPI